jgi:hypothetical protein
MEEIPAAVCSDPERAARGPRGACGSWAVGDRVGACVSEFIHARSQGEIMLLVREIMYCKPGKVRPMVDKFVKMSKLSEKMGMPKMRVMTDLSAERYWTIVSEMEVPSLKALEDMFANMGGNGGQDPNAKEMENIMKDYHDFVEYGRREIYKIEG